MNGLLFDIAPEKPPIQWERSRIDQWGKAHMHTYGDWRIEHCGHPTALFPYTIISPAGRPIYAPNGRGWQNLKDAKTEVERRAKEMQ